MKPPILFALTVGLALCNTNSPAANFGDAAPPLPIELPVNTTAPFRDHCGTTR